MPKYAEMRDDLRARIAAGDFADGRLPALGRLCDQYGASLNTVRRAVHELSDEGLLEISPGRPTHILRRPPADTDELLAALRTAQKAIAAAITALRRADASRAEAS